jgi:ankyrin repeat protein
MLCSVIDINSLDGIGECMLTSLINMIPQLWDSSIADKTRILKAHKFGNLIWKMVELGVNPTMTNINGQSGFECACNHHTIPDSLLIRLANVIDPNAVDHEGKTPIMYAVIRPEIVKNLVSRGAKVNVCDHDGMTPLMHSSACMTDDILLKHGADVTIRDKDGMTALMHRARSNNASMDPYLISESQKHGLINSKDNYGNDAFSLCCDYAEFNGDYKDILFVDTAMALIVYYSNIDMLRFTKALLKITDIELGSKLLTCAAFYSDDLYIPHKYNEHEDMSLYKYLFNFHPKYNVYVDLLETVKHPDILNTTIDSLLTLPELLSAMAQRELSAINPKHKKHILEMRMF